MLTEEMLLAKWRRLPEQERKRLLRRIDELIEQNQTTRPASVPQAVAAVESTWASLSLGRALLRWVAEDKELEYDLSRSPRRR